MVGQAGGQSGDTQASAAANASAVVQVLVQILEGQMNDKPTIAVSEAEADEVNGTAPDSADPQMLVAAAINDVIELARAMSASGLDRGVVEMRRRLNVMDAAVAMAEKAGALVDATAPGTVQ